MKRSFPTFLCIGAHKAGTTWLYRQLLRHPDIWLPPTKEIHFFDRSLRYPSPNILAVPSFFSRLWGTNPWERPRIISGVKSILKRIFSGRFHQAAWWTLFTFGYYNENWYGRLFSQGRGYRASGEITPAYAMLDDDDVARIKTVNPDMRIIFILRNPIERAWSAVRFHAKRAGVKLEQCSADEIIAQLKYPGMVLRGDYARTLNIYLSHFDPSQILICFYDAIKNDPAGFLSGITEHLDVGPFAERAIVNEIYYNVSPQFSMPDKVKDYLVNTYAPLMTLMADRLGSYSVLWKVSGLSPAALQKLYSSGCLPPTVYPSKVTDFG